MTRTRADVVNDFIYSPEFQGDPQASPPILPNDNGVDAESYFSAWTIPESLNWVGGGFTGNPQTITLYYANAYGAAIAQSTRDRLQTLVVSPLA